MESLIWRSCELKVQKVFIPSSFQVSFEVFVLVSKPSISKPGVRRSALSEDRISIILRSVSEQEGFHFYKAVGEPTGETAVSLADFAKKMGYVSVQSVNFHFYRKDFEKWIRDVIGDAELALRISRIRVDLKGEALRNEIIRVVKVRIGKLKAAQP
jgi:hypothetical protein